MFGHQVQLGERRGGEGNKPPRRLSTSNLSLPQQPRYLLSPTVRKRQNLQKSPVPEMTEARIFPRGESQESVGRDAKELGEALGQAHHCPAECFRVVAGPNSEAYLVMFQ